ncbi:hypothetical protein ID866_3031 [Astraeus odoratus]|nr:hypothetical protein ID866_3031 [Astraeus odoratus]
MHTVASCGEHAFQARCSQRGLRDAMQSKTASAQEFVYKLRTQSEDWWPQGNASRA